LIQIGLSAGPKAKKKLKRKKIFLPGGERATTSDKYHPLPLGPLLSFSLPLTISLFSPLPPFSFSFLF